MSLPSQSPRTTTMGRAYVKTRRRKRGLQPQPLAIALFVAGIAVVLVVLAVRGWGGDSGGMSPSQAKADERTLADPYSTRGVRETSSRATPPTGDRPEGVPAIAARPETPPVTIVQGGSSAKGEESALRRSIHEARSGAAGGTSSEKPSEQGEPAKPEEPVAPTRSAGEADAAIAAAEQSLRENQPVVARELLNRVVRAASLPEADRSRVRAKLTELNERLVFSPEVVAGDPQTESYVVAGGDSLAKIVSTRDLAVDWRLLQRVNGLADPSKIRAGQELKLVRGPFHAIVDKSDYRVDIFAGAPDNPEEWVYIRSFRVGLGENDSTPTGSFVVKRNSKLINPHWVNPRTGERFDKDDPKNPIGERWIGIEGLGDDAVKVGFGLHGTIEPESIGGQRSMGCVRMLSEDVALAYEMLVEQVSRVTIVD